MDYEVRTAYFRISTNLSGVVDLGEDFHSIAIGLPGNWTAANLTFQGSETAEAQFREIMDVSGNALGVTATAGRFHSATALSDALRPFRYIKIRSGTLALPVTQAGDNKTVHLLIKTG